MDAPARSRRASSVSEPEMPTDALGQRIKEMLDSNVGSVDYEIAVSRLHQTLLSNFKRAKQQNQENSFLDDLFKRYLSTVKDQSQHLRLLKILTSVDLGDKLSKAERIARDLMSIDDVLLFADRVDPNPVLWRLHFDVLMWLQRASRSSIHLLLNPLRDRAWEFLEQGNDDQLKTGVQIMTLFIDEMPSRIETQRHRLLMATIEALKRPTQGVFETAMGLLRIIVRRHKPLHLELAELVNEILKVFDSKNWKLYDNFIQAAELILEEKPKLDGCFTVVVGRVQDELFDTKDVDVQRGMLMFWPLQCRLTPTFMPLDKKNSGMQAVMKWYKQMIVKKSPLRKDAEFSLGRCLFEMNSELSEQLLQSPSKQPLEDIRKHVQKNLDDDKSVYALIAFASCKQEWLEKDKTVIFQRPFSMLLVEGLRRLINKCPQVRDEIQKRAMRMIQAVMLNTHSPPDLVQLAYKAIDKLEFPIGEFNLPTAVRFAKGLLHRDLGVRKAAGEFAARYQQEKGCPEITAMMFAAVCSETNTEFRRSLLSEIKVSLPSPDIIQILIRLMHDRDQVIENKVLEMAAARAESREWSGILTDYISERIPESRYDVQISKRSLAGLVIIASNIQYTKAVLLPFASFLIRHLVTSKNNLPKDALRLLALILELRPEAADIPLLVAHISSSLTIYSSQRRLSAALDLLLAALRVTDLRFSIYNEHVHIIRQMLEVSKLSDLDVSYARLIRALGSVSVMSPSFIQKQQGQMLVVKKQQILETPLSFLNGAEYANPADCLLYVSVGVTLVHLLRILMDDSLSMLHASSLDVLERVLKLNKEIAGGFESMFLSEIVHLVTDGSPMLVSVLLEKLTKFIPLLCEKFAPLVPHIVKLVEQEWEKADKRKLIGVTEKLMIYVGVAFKPYLPRVVELFLKDFNLCDDFHVVDEVFSVMERFAPHLGSAELVVYPALLDWILYNSKNTRECKEVLQKLQIIFEQNGTANYSVQIINTVTMIALSNPDLQDNLMTVLSVVAGHMGPSFRLHLPHIEMVFRRDGSPNVEFNEDLKRAIKEIDKITHLPRVSIQGLDSSRSLDNRKSSTYWPKKELSIVVPDKSWDEGRWLAWANEHFASLMNSSRAVSASTAIAERHAEFREAIYPLSVVLAYVDSDGAECERLKETFNNVLMSQHAPTVLVRHYLSAVELLEIMDLLAMVDARKRPPVDPQDLARVAEQAGFLPQAIRYYEKAFEARGSHSEAAEKLIILNHKLGLKLSVNGILRCSEVKNQDIAEKLGHWDEALQLYNDQHNRNPDDVSVIKGRVRCLRALLRFDDMYDTAPKGSIDKAIACWNTFRMDEFSQLMDNVRNDEGTDDAIYRLWHHLQTDKPGSLSLLSGRLWDASLQKENTLFPMIAEDYERTIGPFAYISLLSLTEEIMQYRRWQRMTSDGVPKDKESAIVELEKLRKLWKIKYNNLPDDTGILFRVVRLLSIVIPEKEMGEQFSRLLNVAISQRYTALAYSVLAHLQSLEMPPEIVEELKMIKPRVLWAEAKHDDAIDELLSILPDIHDTNTVHQARYFLGDWLHKRQRTNESYEQLEKLMQDNPDQLEYWSLWARVTVSIFELTHENKYLFESFTAAMECMIRDPNPLGLSLRVLSNLFRRGSQEMYALFKSKVSSIPLHIWLEVIPQIIARLSSSDQDMLSILNELVIRVGMAHPYPVLCSLLVPFKSDNQDRHLTAQSFMDKFSVTFPSLVEQTVKLGDEFIRTAMSWWEICCMKLTDAFAAFSKDNNPEEMLSLLTPVREITTKKPESFQELMFHSMFGDHLSTAESLIEEYITTRDLSKIYQALRHYDFILQGSGKLVRDNSGILYEGRLVDASPFLAEMKDAEVAVPGTYKYDEPIVRIGCFKPNLEIIESKQRPRKMAIVGSDGLDYVFLLKGNEDIRLDERVMQLFGYINTLVSRSNIDLRKRLSIKTYNVVPFTNKVGLIGWVQNCTGLYNIIEKHRQKAGIEMDPPEETVKMAEMARPHNFADLPVKNRAEIFERAMNLVSDGCELKTYLLSGARDSSDWLERRTTYTATLAMTSICGYILGLGDRHLCNIMMETKSAHLVHIDFGDCFEVAIHRDEFPEKVPFRLTRVLVGALEVSKIEGTFRSCCENVMSLLRVNQDNILELFEAFIYDPLIQWTEKLDQDDKESAVAVVERIRDKLRGCDFADRPNLDVSQQVDALICEATDITNLCQMPDGWGPWL